LAVFILTVLGICAVLAGLLWKSDARDLLSLASALIP